MLKVSSRGRETAMLDKEDQSMLNALRWHWGQGVRDQLRRQDLDGHPCRRARDSVNRQHCHEAADGHAERLRSQGHESQRHRCALGRIQQLVGRRATAARS